MKDLTDQELCDKAQGAMQKLEKIAVKARSRAIASNSEGAIIASDYFYSDVLKMHASGLSLCRHASITPSFGGK